MLISNISAQTLCEDKGSIVHRRYNTQRKKIILKKFTRNKSSNTPTDCHHWLSLKVKALLTCTQIFLNEYLALVHKQTNTENKSLDNSGQRENIQTLMLKSSCIDSFWVCDHRLHTVTASQERTHTLESTSFFHLFRWEDTVLMLTLVSGCFPSLNVKIIGKSYSSTTWKNSRI